MLKAELVKGKIHVTRKVTEDYEFNLNKETIKNLDMMTYNWNVTRDEAINFIINSFYDLLDNGDNCEDNIEKEVMKNQERKFNNNLGSNIGDTEKVASNDSQWSEDKSKENLIANI